MRRLIFSVVIFAAACGDNVKSNTPVDASPSDATPDGTADAMPDGAVIPDGIADARAADGSGLDLPIRHAIVTYLKPQIGDLTNDPAGFTIQASQTGPALFVSVDPATLTPPAEVGDVVDFTITTMGKVGLQPRAQAIAAYTRVSTNADVGALVQNISAATDLVSMIDDYDSEIVTITGTAFESFATASGSGFRRSGLDTAGITGDTNLQLRAPTTLVDALDMALGCQITATRIPVSRFNAQAQLVVYSAADFTMTNCPAPVVTTATALSGTSVRITFSRNILATSVLADGSQFTFTNGLTASAATVSGRTVTLTTDAQAAATTYTVTVANTVTDLQGSSVGTPNDAMFGGFVTPAVVRINEVNANITSGCDLIELRVVAGGSMTGFKIQERNGGSGELAFTFPAFAVQTNDFVVIHLNAGSATCNANTATSETTSVTDQPAAMFAGNIDTAYDFWNADPGLTSTDNVFTLFDATGAIHDAVFISDDPAGPLTAAATETAAAAVGAANQWDPALATYLDTVFRTNAVDDLNATGTTAAGTSIQRIDDTDDNDKADWTTGAGAASTWGALNAGQTAL